MVSSAFSFIISNVSPLRYPDISTVAKSKNSLLLWEKGDRNSGG